jgi:hypothetical protein
MGYALETPLLVPSFSSCAQLPAVEYVPVSARDLLEGTCEQLTESFLVSAYDIAEKNIPDPNEFGAMPQLTIVDSGGFESLVMSSSSRSVGSEWTEASYRAVIAQWPRRFPAAFVSFDSPTTRVPYEEQVARARDLLGPNRSHMSIFLLKPQNSKEASLSAVLDRICNDPGDLRDFDIVGATEKELGGSLVDRMTSIARLRLALDAASISAAIHVFGGLDPLSTYAYFLAGAEVFDGLSWLRYGYHSGLAIYVQNAWLLTTDGVLSDSTAYFRMVLQNICYLTKMRNEMQRFTIEHSFDRLETVQDYRRALERAFDMLKTRPCLKGRL